MYNSGTATLTDCTVSGNVASGNFFFGYSKGGGVFNSGTATLTKPSVAEIRARASVGRPKLDARGRAMQATAGKIKPLSTFIYRAMQVGVLLVTAGTILGGVWADYSWGRFWGWDPKEVWALITLLVYLVPLHGRFAGLMCGLAGLGWGLLRFARWDTIPSVLTLQPPLAPGSRRA